MSMYHRLKGWNLEKRRDLQSKKMATLAAASLSLLEIWEKTCSSSARGSAFIRNPKRGKRVKFSTFYADTEGHQTFRTRSLDVMMNSENSFAEAARSFSGRGVRTTTNA